MITWQNKANTLHDQRYQDINGFSPFKVTEEPPPTYVNQNNDQSSLYLLV